MVMEAIVQSIQDRSEEGEFDALTDVLGDLGGRPQELFWKEDDNGRLFVGDANTGPSVIARIELLGDDLDVEEVAPDSVNWRRMRTISQPESAIRDRAFD